MPGPFTRGTSHFSNASHASDTMVTERYGELEPFAARLAEVGTSFDAMGYSELLTVKQGG